MPTNLTPRELGILQRYVLIGAALGLYYGIFYTPSGTDPDYGSAIVLSLLAALITVAIRFWKKRPSFSIMLRAYGETLILFLVFMLTLAARTYIVQLGGKIALVVFTTVVGCGMGYGLATRKVSA
ncbi:MAG: hypothetical protein JNL73_07680 [Anaerolineales bacterium]|nr:hypothetical protein [Anaerolineales bacterium]